MFKKNERLTTSEFSDYFKKGKKHHFPALTIATQPSPSRKVAVVVGKKVAKSAVRRNMLKRRVYAALREILIAEDYTGVLIVVLKNPFNSLTRKAADDLLRGSIGQVLKSA